MLADQTLTVTMRDHYPSEQSARGAVETYLRAWEIRHALELGTGRLEFHFDFERSELVDRDPPPPGEPQIIAVAATIHARAIVSSALSVERGAYPSPPFDFALDLDVETLWLRWQGDLAGREPLQSMAYFCLTVLDIYGGEHRASDRFHVSRKVLETISRLSTTTGDPLTARKASRSLRPLTDPERTWLETSIRALIRRAGEVAANPEKRPRTLTMADLPALMP